MATSKSRILIADDEKNIRFTLAHALERSGYEIATAVNGEDALKQMEATEFDLLLLDLRMPGMDGMDVLKEAAERYPATRVVIVTAHGTVDNAVEAVKLGAVDFIQKPFSPTEIRDLVAQVLDREHIRSEEAHDYATHLALAKRSINQRRFAQAMEYVKEAIAIDPGRPEAFNLLGVLQEIEGSRHDALKNYRIALDIDPSYEPARRNLGRSGDPHVPGTLNLG